MKVLYFVGYEIGGKNGNIGGDPSQVRGMIDGLKKLGHEVVYASVNAHKYMDRKDYNIEAIKENTIPIPKLRGLLFQWNTIKTVEKLIQKHRPNIIVSFWSNNPFILRLNRYKIPIILICNIPLSMEEEGVITSYYDKINLQTATLSLMVSQDMTEYLKKKYGDKLGRNIITNPNGVNTDMFTYRSSDIRNIYKIDDSIPLIGFAGHFAPWHRIDLLIGAVQELEQNVRLLLIGNGPIDFENNLKVLARQKYPERIIFTGPIPFSNIPEYYSACDILVVPQDKNRPLGSSMKLYEYMSMGKAIAAADVGQISQIIKHGENGMLFEPNIENLKKVLDILIKSPELRKNIGKKARKDAVEKHSWESNLERVIALLNDKSS